MFANIGQRIVDIKARPGVWLTDDICQVPVGVVKDVCEAVKNKQPSGIGSKIVKFLFADVLEQIKQTEGDMALSKKCMVNLFSLAFMKEFVGKKGKIDWENVEKVLTGIHHEIIANGGRA